MEYSDKIVVQLPLKSIWNDHKEVAFIRKRFLTKEDLKSIIKQQPIEFVIADIGEKLEWITIEKCYEFWKSEVDKHIGEDLNQIILEDYPGEYAYIASEWAGENNEPIILLEITH
jgi:hypothetical protein